MIQVFPRTFWKSLVLWFLRKVSESACHLQPKINKKSTSSSPRFCLALKVMNKIGFSWQQHSSFWKPWSYAAFRSGQSDFSTWKKFLWLNFELKSVLFFWGTSSAAWSRSNGLWMVFPVHITSPRNVLEHTHTHFLVFVCVCPGVASTKKERGRKLPKGTATSSSSSSSGVNTMMENCLHCLWILRSNTHSHSVQTHLPMGGKASLL